MIAGWLVGALVLVLAIPLETALTRIVSRLSLRQLFFALSGVSLFVVGAGIVIINIGAPFQVPELWTKNAEVFSSVALNPLVIDTVVISASTLLGLGFGGAYAAEKGFPVVKSSHPFKILVLRWLTGSIGLLLILGIFYYPVKLTSGNTFVSEALSFLEFALTGFWISGFSFSIFSRIGLMQEKK